MNSDELNKFKILKTIKKDYDSFFRVMEFLKQKQEKILENYRQSLLKRKRELEDKKL